MGDSDVISFHLYQMVFAAILWIKLLEMFVTLLTLNTLCRQVNDDVDIFLNLLVKLYSNNVDSVMSFHPTLVRACVCVRQHGGELEAVCPSHLAGSGWLHYGFFGRDTAMIDKLNGVVSSLMTDNSLLSLYTHLLRADTHQCPW